VTSPALAIQSILNNGMTSVVSNLGAGVTNTISNSANNLLIQKGYYREYRDYRLVADDPAECDLDDAG
jgi:hypothetical protein